MGADSTKDPGDIEASWRGVRNYLSTAETSGDDTVDALVRGTAFKWGPSGLMGQSTSVTYSFLTSAPSYNAVSSFEEFNATMKSAARQAFAEWSSVANISFVEVSSGGTIQLGTESMSNAAGYAYYPGNDDIAGDIWIANNFDYNTAPVVGNYGYLTLMHEIGHAIGLKHPGAYGADDVSPFLPSSVDNTDNTVMSYTDGTAIYPVDVGPYDIQAARYLYGHSGSGTIGNVTFGTDAAEVFTGDSGIQYIHGRDGADFINLLGGNDGATAGSGVDTVLGGDGSDLIYGNVGADLLSGGASSDTIFGGQNDGPASTGSASDQPSAFRSGVETINGGDGNDLLYGNHGTDLMIGGAGIDSLFGGQDSDTLSGGSGNDSLYGNRGDDVLIGGDGFDRFVFGAASGDDTISDFTFFTDYLVIQSNVNGSGIASFSDVVGRATQSGADVIIDLGGGNSITLQNYSTGSLISADVLIF